MPINSTDSGSAAAAARSETEKWRLLADGGWHVTELDVVIYFDPRDDLDKRASRWSFDLRSRTLSNLALFAAALAQSEAEAWERDEAHVATQALEERRFLLGDRILHWAVPWLAEQGTEESVEAMAILLALGEEHRPAPLLSGDEGMFAPGEDSYGPIDRRPFDSVWRGAVLPPDVDPVEHLALAATRWEAFTEAYPGSARLWHDLARRCRL